MNYSIIFPTNNRKLGPIIASRTQAKSCPDTCELKNNGCYAQKGPESLQWKRLEKSGLTIDEFCEKLRAMPAKTLFRHNTAGDIVWAHMKKIIKSSKHLDTLAYTHHTNNIKEIKYALSHNFCINASANSYTAALNFMAQGIPAVFVVDKSFAKSKNETIPEYLARFKQTYAKAVPCPQQYKPELTCNKCRICAKIDRSKPVAFVKH